MQPKYPEVRVKLSGQDGNSFFILGKVAKALRDAGVSKAEILTFQQEATRGDYNHLLLTCMRWVEVK